MLRIVLVFVMGQWLRLRPDGLLSKEYEIGSVVE